MKERFVKLKDLNGFDDEFLNALAELEQRVLVSGAFGEGQASVWGFIAKSDFQVKNKKKSGGEFIDFKEGDLLMSAGWRTPALNKSRGNIFSDDYNVQWTGPNYLI